MACLLPALAVLVFGNQTATPASVELSRLFTKGQTLKYTVHSELNMQQRTRPLITWIPSDLDIDYDFTMNVLDQGADGTATVHYLRPKMIITDGETFNSGPKASTEKINLDANLTLSPTNEILGIKENHPDKTDSHRISNRFAYQGEDQNPLSQILGNSIQDLYRLALFTGNFDSALDITPKLPGTKLKVGDTWMKTVGYSPQKKKNNAKNIVQRLDYQYVYKGTVTQNGKTFQRIEADLNLDTDLAQFINDTFDVKSEDTGLKKVPIQLKAHIIWSLDPVTRDPVYAEATSEGAFQIFLDQNPDDPVTEMKLKGRTTMQLANRSTAHK